MFVTDRFRLKNFVDFFENLDLEAFKELTLFLNQNTLKIYLMLLHLALEL